MVIKHSGPDNNYTTLTFDFIQRERIMMIQCNQVSVVCFTSCQGDCCTSSLHFFFCLF